MHGTQRHLSCGWHQPRRTSRMQAIVSTCILVLGLFGGDRIAAFRTFADDVAGAQQNSKDAEKKTPIGQFVTVSSPIDDVVYAAVSSAAIKLQNQAVQEARPAILVLQIEPGTSQFHHAQGLAKFLTSAQIANVTTVAWVGQTVTGPNVLVALACRQIVMHPEAELGDIGRGKNLDLDEQQFVLALAQKRHNSKLNAALVRGMMDQSEQLLRVRVRVNENGRDELESRIVTKNELEALRKTNLTIEDVDQVPVKEAGQLGTLRGEAMRRLDALVVHTSESRTGVAEFFGLPRESLREQSADREVKKVRLIKVEGVIDTLQESFLQRQIDRSVADGAQAIIFEIHSPSGHLNASVGLANSIANLSENKIRTIAYVPREAVSGAAIISLGCDEIYLHPDARIGDAGPIEMRPGHAFERSPEKILNPLRASLAELAEKKHRPVAICEAMADRSVKVFQVTHRDNGRVWYMSEAEVHASNGEWNLGPQLGETNGEVVFTANGERASELKLAEPSVRDFDELKGRLGIPAATKVTPVERTWVDDMVFVLNSPGMVVLMIILGVVFLYLELHFMTGILGILSVLCFALFFWARVLGGTSGWLEITLFVIGLGCLAIELFAIPGFGVFGVSGILLIIASLVLAGHRWSFDASTNIEELTWQSGQVLFSMGVVAAMGMGAARYLPNIPIFESMVLGPPGSGGTSEPQLRPTSSDTELVGFEGLVVGARGVTITMLRPAGKANVNEQVVDVVSEGPFISANQPIQVVEISGNRIVVRVA